MVSKNKRVCQICGNEFELKSACATKRQVCYHCLPEHIKGSEADKIKRNGLKKEGVKLLGSKCRKCGYDRCISILNFHHVNKEQKMFKISDLLVNNLIKEFFSEILKCIVLCPTCHMEFHHLEETEGITIGEYLNEEEDVLLRNQSLKRRYRHEIRYVEEKYVKEIALSNSHKTE